MKQKSHKNFVQVNNILSGGSIGNLPLEGTRRLVDMRQLTSMTMNGEIADPNRGGEQTFLRVPHGTSVTNMGIHSNYQSNSYYADRTKLKTAGHPRQQYLGSVYD